MTNQNVTVALVSDTGFVLWKIPAHAGFTLRDWLTTHYGSYDQQGSTYVLGDIVRDARMRKLESDLKDVRAQRDRAVQQLGRIREFLDD